jgi:hypothetical protein
MTETPMPDESMPEELWHAVANHCQDSSQTVLTDWSEIGEDGRAAYRKVPRPGLDPAAPARGAPGWPPCSFATLTSASPLVPAWHECRANRGRRWAPARSASRCRRTAEAAPAVEPLEHHRLMARYEHPIDPYERIVDNIDAELSVQSALRELDWPKELVHELAQHVAANLTYVFDVRWNPRLRSDESHRWSEPGDSPGATLYFAECLTCGNVSEAHAEDAAGELFNAHRATVHPADDI